MKKIEPQYGSNFPMLWLAAAFAVGAVAGNFLMFPNHFLAISLLTALCSLFLFNSVRQFSTVLLIAFCAVGAVLANLSATQKQDNFQKLIMSGVLENNAPMILHGTVDAKPEDRFEGRSFILELREIDNLKQKIEASGRVEVFLPEPVSAERSEEKIAEIRRGSHIAIACRPVVDEGFLNPGVVSKLQVMKALEVDASVAVKSYKLIDVIAVPEFRTPFDIAADWRSTLIERIRKLFEQRTAGVLIASMLGNKHFLDKQTGDAFRDGGTFHLLVISGLHISVIGAVFLLGMSAITRSRVLQSIIAGIALWMFAIAVGGDFPVIRAATMFTFLIVGRAFYRDSSTENSLGASVLFLIAWRPQDIISPSFLLTISSVAAIVFVAVPLLKIFQNIGEWMPMPQTPFPPKIPVTLRQFCEYLYWDDSKFARYLESQVWSAAIEKRSIKTVIIRRALRTVFETFLVSFAVQVAVLPISIFQFRRMTPTGVVQNLWAAFWMAAESLVAIFAVFLSFVSENAALPLVKITEFCNAAMLWLPQRFYEVGILSFRVPPINGYGATIYVFYLLPLIALIVLLYRLDVFQRFDANFVKKNLRFIYCCSAALLIIAAIILVNPFNKFQPNGLLNVEFIDVGQGDSAFVTFPDGRSMLIDGGGRINFGKNYARTEENLEPTFQPDSTTIGEAVITPFLLHNGIRHVDILIATHADTDHIQGLIDVVKNFSVGEILVGRFSSEDEDFAELMREAARKNVPVRIVGEGETNEIGPVNIEFMNPVYNDSPNALATNNESVITKISYGSRSFLFMGDAEAQTELRITSEYSERLKSDVVKVSHHGSRTSSISNFVATVKPEYAVISVGRRSAFGHPHKEVVERWKENKAKVLTTGERGTLKFSTDGRSLNYDAFLKNGQ